MTPKQNAEFSSQPQSTRSASPLSDLSGSWVRPKSVKQFTAQVNAVSTMLLNGNLDLETARAYGSLARTTAQAIGSELMAARMRNEKPDLEFEELPEGCDDET